MDHFSNRLVLITGGSSGIGLALAKAFAQKGSNVWVLGRRVEQLEAALAALETCRQDSRQNFGIISADVSDSERIFSELTSFCEKIGVPDYLINSAGIVQPGEFTALDLEFFRSMMDVNYFGIVHCTKAVVPYMLRRSSGHIINISSMAGFVGLYGYTGYCASKFAVRGFSDALRSELKSQNIRVSLVYPPDTQTPQLEYDNLHKPPITKEVSANAGLMQPDAVAKSIIHGIQRQKYVITPGFEASLIYTVQGFTGNLLYTVVDLLVAQARRKLEKEAS